MTSLFQAALKDIAWRNAHPEVKEQECISTKGPQWRQQTKERWERDGLPDPVVVKPEGVRHFSPAPAETAEGESVEQAPRVYAHNFKVDSVVRHTPSGDIGRVVEGADAYDTALDVLWTQGQRIGKTSRVAAFDLESVGKRKAEYVHQWKYQKDPGAFSENYAQVRNAVANFYEAQRVLKQDFVKDRQEWEWVLEDTRSFLNGVIPTILSLQSE